MITYANKSDCGLRAHDSRVRIVSMQNPNNEIGFTVRNDDWSYIPTVTLGDDWVIGIFQGQDYGAPVGQMLIGMFRADTTDAGYDAERTVPLPDYTVDTSVAHCQDLFAAAVVAVAAQVTGITYDLNTVYDVACHLYGELFD